MAEKVKVTNMRKISERPDTRGVRAAFDKFEGKRETVVMMPQREHLGRSFRKGISCSHTWLPLVEEKAVKQAEAVLEESGIEGSVEFCTECGATCLRGDGRIWAYDATYDVIAGRSRFASIAS